MKKYLLLPLFIFCALPLYPQCFCAEIKFRLVLKDLKVEKDNTRYLIRMIRTPKQYTALKERSFNKYEISADTATFQFVTGGGIDTLKFAVRDVKLNKEMVVTVLHMHYDNPYYIDLTAFTEGHFLFDWKIINQCQEENMQNTDVNCNGKKFQQLQLVDTTRQTWPTGFMHNKIKPLNLSTFKMVH